MSPIYLIAGTLSHPLCRHWASCSTATMEDFRLNPKDTILVLIIHLLSTAYNTAHHLLPLNMLSLQGLRNTPLLESLLLLYLSSWDSWKCPVSESLKVSSLIIITHIFDYYLQFSILPWTPGLFSFFPFDVFAWIIHIGLKLTHLELDLPSTTDPSPMFPTS